MSNVFNLRDQNEKKNKNRMTKVSNICNLRGPNEIKNLRDKSET